MSSLFDKHKPPEPQPKPRAKPRVLMHVVEAGGDGCGSEPGEHSVVMECRRCGHRTGWFTVASATEGKRGLPCPKCNQDAASRRQPPPAAKPDSGRQARLGGQESRPTGSEEVGQ